MIAQQSANVHTNGRFAMFTLSLETLNEKPVPHPNAFSSSTAAFLSQANGKPDDLVAQVSGVTSHLRRVIARWMSKELTPNFEQNSNSWGKNKAVKKNNADISYNNSEEKAISFKPKGDDQRLSVIRFDISMVQKGIPGSPDENVADVTPIDADKVVEEAQDANTTIGRPRKTPPRTKVSTFARHVIQPLNRVHSKPRSPLSAEVLPTITAKQVLRWLALPSKRPRRHLGSKTTSLQVSKPYNPSEPCGEPPNPAALCSSRPSQVSSSSQISSNSITRPFHRRPPLNRPSSIHGSHPGLKSNVCPRPTNVQGARKIVAGHPLEKEPRKGPPRRPTSECKEEFIRNYVHLRRNIERTRSRERRFPVAGQLMCPMELGVVYHAGRKISRESR